MNQEMAISVHEGGIDKTQYKSGELVKSSRKWNN